VFGEKPSATLKALLVLAALALAWLTWRLLERPVQQMPRRSPVVRTLALSMAGCGILGVLVQAGALRERMPANGVAPYLRALNDLGFPDPAMTPLRYNGSLFQQLAGQGRGTTVLLGDSVMEQYAPLVAQRLRDARFDRRSVIFATHGGCPPIPDAIRLPLLRFPDCRQAVDDGYALAAAPAVDTVVIAASWYGYFAHWWVDLQMPVGATLERFPSPRAHAAAYASLQRSIAQLRARGKRVFLILQPPSGNLFDPRSMISGSRFGEMKPRTGMEAFRVDRFRSTNAAPRSRLLEIARRTGSIAVDPVDYLCKAGICPVVDAAGEPLYTDPVHMRPFFVRSAVHYLDPALTSPVPPRVAAASAPLAPP